MSREVCEAAKKADVFLLRKMLEGSIHFPSLRDTKGQNVLHQIMQLKDKTYITREDFVEIIKKFLECHPLLIIQKDSEGNTPIHVLARNRPDTLLSIVSRNRDKAQRKRGGHQYFQNNYVIPMHMEYHIDPNGKYLRYNDNSIDLSPPQRLSDSQLQGELLDLFAEIIRVQATAKDFNPPWKMKNDAKNTPLHEALIIGNLEAARKLFEFDNVLVEYANKHKYTPIHLLFGCSIEFTRLSRPGKGFTDEAQSMIKADIEAASSPDEDGLLLLTTFQKGNSMLFSSLCKHFPKLAEIRDSHGETIWHKLAKERVFSRLESKSEYWEPLCTHCAEATTIPDGNDQTIWHLVAIDADNIDPVFMKELCNRCHESAKITANGDTIWHKLVKEGVAAEFMGNRDYWEPLFTHCAASAEIKDLKGQTIWHHIAMDFYSVDPAFMKLLCEKCHESAKITNFEGETIWHKLVKQGVVTEFEGKKDYWEPFFTHCAASATIQDSKGQTIWHQIAKDFHNVEDSFVNELCRSCQDSSTIQDNKGQTFWHLAGIRPLYQKEDKNKYVCLFKDEFVKDIFKLKNNDGKTPLHLAIEKGFFGLAKIFLTYKSSTKTMTREERKKWQLELLELQDSKGTTPGDLIGSSKLPAYFEEFVAKEYALQGFRSVWGIPTTEIKDYVNMIGVIAALLTTITFTAAFTVPGGLNQDTGVPILMRQPAFQVFLMSDVLAMCLSMMVLFCLLWILTTGNKAKSVVLLDMSILLLQGAFYTTVLTFMMGVYATTFNTVPWISLVTLAMCSLLIVIMHQFFVMKFLIPLGKLILFVYRMFSPYTRDFMKWCKDPNRCWMRIYLSCRQVNWS